MGVILLPGNVRNVGLLLLSVVGLLVALLGKGDDPVGNPHRSQIVRFEFVELTYPLVEA